MNASELKRLWQKQQSIELTPEKIARITATVNTLDRTFRREILWRDLREIAAGLVAAAFFGLVGQTWFRWLAVAGCLFVVAWIIGSRITIRRPREMPSVTGRLHQMIRETEMQIGLTRSVLWWYLLPCAVAIFAMVLDKEKSSPRDFNLSFHLVFLSVGGALFAAIYWLNQRAVRQKLVPRRAKLCHALAELSERS